MESLVQVEHIYPRSIESISMSVFHALPASTVNCLDRQMPQGLAMKDSCAEVVPNFQLQTTQVMFTMDLVLLGIIVKKEH